MFDNLDFMLEHRSIRSWKKDPIPEELMSKLFDVANRTSTSNSMQNSSIIRVKDPNKREQLAQIAGQEYLKHCPELLVFLVDNYRNVSIMEEKGCKEIYANDSDRFFQGWTDACLMAQSISTAAELNDLGIVYFGAILNDARKVIEILNLPKNTFPVVGLGIGYPNQNPQKKPRIDVEHKVFVDEYEKRDSYLETLKEYDKVMQTYYDLRKANKPVDAFTDQVVEKNNKLIANRSEIFDVIREQGFRI